MLQLYKYHGTGNDFILLDNRAGKFNPERSAIAHLCHRRFGVGADGLILLENKAGYDFSMRYYNADGNESSMCGNGGRCITAFADFLSLPGSVYNFYAIDGAHTGIVLKRDNNVKDVRLSMNDVVAFRKWGEDDMMNTGSPHLVRFIEDFSGIDIVKDGRRLRFHPDFKPEGLNVNFVRIDGNSLFVRTYERGVEDETLSCGTGVTASALAFALKKEIFLGPVRIETPGGSLILNFRRIPEGFTDIWLEGPAEKVFETEIEIKA